MLSAAEAECSALTMYEFVCFVYLAWWPSCKQIHVSRQRDGLVSNHAQHEVPHGQHCFFLKEEILVLPDPTTRPECVRQRQDTYIWAQGSMVICITQ